MGMQRSRRILVVCHCLLNANAKVRPLAAQPGAALALLAPYLERGTGLFQLPCPELCHLGGNRWGMTREQYDCRPYRRLLRALAQTAADQLAALVRDGCRIEAVLGVDGSPSCGVFATCLGFTGGEPGPGGVDMAEAAKARLVPGAGLFIEALRRELAEAGLSPPFWAVNEASPTAIYQQPSTGCGGTP
jgi:predicted secreted protein